MKNMKIKNSGLHVIAITIFFLIVLGGIWIFDSVKEAFQVEWDIVLRWTTCQYVRARVNPYPVALQILQQTFGSVHGTERVRLGEVQIFSMPKNASSQNILPNYGPPEPVYPPFEILVQMIITGFLPRYLVVPVWTMVNLAALVCLFLFLTRRHSSFQKPTLVSSPMILAVLLIWPPTQLAISHTQYSIVVLGLLLLAYSDMETGKPIRAGICLSLSLIKPSLSLPFLIVPLVKRQWKTLSVIVGSQILSLIIFSFIVRSMPWNIISVWLQVAQYFTSGMYSIQEILNRFTLENTPIGNMIIVGFLAAITLLCWYKRNNNNSILFDFACVVSVFWTYHGSYDFVILLPPFLSVLRDNLSTMEKEDFKGIMMNCLWIGCFVVLGLALYSPIYQGDGSIFRLIRWGGRFALLGMFAWSAARLFLSRQQAGYR